MRGDFVRGGRYQVEACLQVSAGAERLVASTGDDGDQGALIITKACPGFDQFKVGGRPDAVALVRAIEADDPDRPVRLVVDLCERHSR
ncbi:hypothetical protein D3C71_2072120 [compost metagenome]